MVGSPAMQRFVVVSLFVGAACGGKSSTPPVANAGSGASPEAAESTEECAATVESAKAGNHDRYAFETNDGRYGYKNKRGDTVIAPTLRYAYEFKPGGIAAAVSDDGTFVFIDPNGKVIARAFAYDNGPDYFQEGYARIVDGGKIGFIDDKGHIVIPPRFDEALGFCHGKAQVREAGKQLYIDKQGKPTTPPENPPPPVEET
jgi:hypothetical protein